MHRRHFLATSATILTSTAGCAGILSEDSDDDGVPDGDDVAPSDPQVDHYMEGDPPPSVAKEVRQRDEDTLTLRLTHEGGGYEFTPENTERLEVNAEGEPVGTLSLPFGVADTRTVSGVPVGPYVNLVWFAAGRDDAAVVERWRFES